MNEVKHFVVESCRIASSLFRKTCSHIKKFYVYYIEALYYVLLVGAVQHVVYKGFRLIDNTHSNHFMVLSLTACVMLFVALLLKRLPLPISRRQYMLIVCGLCVVWFIFDGYYMVFHLHEILALRHEWSDPSMASRAFARTFALVCALHSIATLNLARHKRRILLLSLESLVFFRLMWEFLIFCTKESIEAIEQARKQSLVLLPLHLVVFCIFYALDRFGKKRVKKKHPPEHVEKGEQMIHTWTTKVDYSRAGYASVRTKNTWRHEILWSTVCVKGKATFKYDGVDACTVESASWSHAPSNWLRTHWTTSLSHSSHNTSLASSALRYSLVNPSNNTITASGSATIYCSATGSVSFS